MSPPVNKSDPIHIIGATSVEGAAVAQFFLKHGFSKLTAHDTAPAAEFQTRLWNNHPFLTEEEKIKLYQTLRFSPIEFRFASQYLNDLHRAKWVFATQNWRNCPANFPHLWHWHRTKGPVQTMVDLYFAFCPAPIIAITGTNGKTTTTNLLHSILSQERKTYISGNDFTHPQILPQITSLTSKDFLILEISNRQLMDFQHAPDIAILTNITQDHLQEHPSFQDYIQTKLRLIQHQSKAQIAVLNETLPFPQKLPPTQAKVYTFGWSHNANFSVENHWIVQRSPKTAQIAPCHHLALRGKHNLENTLAATAAAYLAGVHPNSIAQGLKSFQGVKNRLQLVRQIEGIQFYNDLAATSPAATKAALQTLQRPVILIAGGYPKGADYFPLAKEISQHAKLLILLESPLKDILLQLPISTPISVASTLREALTIAYQNAQNGDKILFSPSAAGAYQQFVQKEGGFIRMVKKLKRKQKWAS